MTELQMGQNAPLPTAPLSAVLSWDPGRVGVDLSALLLTSAGTVRSDADFVFYNQPEHGSGAVRHVPGTGGTGRVDVDPGRVEADIERIAVVASADGGSFGEVSGLVLTLTDGSGAELLRFPMRAGTETALLTGEIYRRAGDWKFRAVAQGWAAGLAGLARDFGITVDDAPAPPVAAPAAPPVNLKKQQLVDMEKRVGAAAPALLSLTKRAAVSLEKRGLGEHTARVALCLDISGSMFALYRQGKVQALAERVLALALRFDDDGEVDVFLFGRDAYQDEPMNLDNHHTYVASMLERRSLEAGTRYGLAIEAVRRHYGGVQPGPRSTPAMAQVPAYVMFLTDGATTDQDKTREQLTSASYEPLFWQFMAIGREGSREFEFLQKLDDLEGRYVDNADFFTVEDPTAIPDDVLFDKLMTEYPAWLREARAKGLLPPA